MSRSSQQRIEPSEIPEATVLIRTDSPTVLETWDLYLSELCEKVVIDHCPSLGRVSVDYDLMQYTPDLVVVDAFSSGDAGDTKKIVQLQHHIQTRNVPLIIFGDLKLSAPLNESLHDALHTELISEKPQAKHIREIAFRHLRPFLRPEYQNFGNDAKSN